MRRLFSPVVGLLLAAALGWLLWSSSDQSSDAQRVPGVGAQRLEIARPPPEGTDELPSSGQRSVDAAAGNLPSLLPGFGGLRIVTIDTSARPVGGVSIVVFALSRSWVAISGADGAAQLADLPAGVPVTVGSDRAADRTVVLAAGVWQTIRLEVAPARELTVCVIDHDGVPVADALVWAGARPVATRAFEADGRRVLSGRTDREGRIRFRSVWHGLRLEAWGPGAPPNRRAARELVDVTPGESTVTLRLPGDEPARRGCRLAVRVVDENGTAIPGAQVELVALTGMPLRWPEATATSEVGVGEPRTRVLVRTGQDGEAVWDRLRDQFVVYRASANGRQTVTRAVQEFPHRDEVVLQPVAPVHVRVSSQGRPVAFAEVTVGGAPATYTDPTGEVTVDAPIGRRPVRAVRSGLGEDEAEVLVEAGRHCDCQLTIDPGLHLTGRLQDPSGNALPGWKVTMSESVSFTDAQGRFVLGNVPDGVHALRITRPSRSAVRMDGAVGDPGPDFVRYVDTEAGAVEWTVPTERGALVGKLRTTAASEEGRPWLEYASETGARGLAQVFADGSFAMWRLPVGRYWITTTLAGTRPRLKRRFGPFEVCAGQECRVGELAIEEEVAVTALVDSRSIGRTPSRVWVAEDGGRLVGVTPVPRSRDRVGRSVLRLPPGRYSIGLVCDGVDATGRPLEVVAGRPQSVRLVARLAPSWPVRVDLPWGARRVVTVRAFDVRGNPVFGASWRDTDFVERTIGLPPGTYRFVATWQHRRAEQVATLREGASPPTVRLRLDR